MPARGGEQSVNARTHVGPGGRIVEEEPEHAEPNSAERDQREQRVVGDAGGEEAAVRGAVSDRGRAEPSTRGGPKTGRAMARGAATQAAGLWLRGGLRRSAADLLEQAGLEVARPGRAAARRRAP